MPDEPLHAELADGGAHASLTVSLTAAEAEELLRQVSELTRSQLNLAEGLRAAAEGSSQPRLALALREVADQLTAGMPPEAALSSARLRLPSSVSALVAAAVRSGDCGEVLSELLDLKESLAEVRREIRSAVAYPLLMLLATGATALLVLNAVVPAFGQMFREFDLPLPDSTASLLWLSSSGQWLFLGWLAVFTLLAVAARYCLPWPLWCRVRGALPVVGPIFLWSAAAEFARLVSLLVEHEIPFPQAVRLAADSSSDGEVAVAGRRVAQALSQGVSAATAFEQESQTFPLVFVPYLRLGQRTGRTGTALAGVSEMLFEKVLTRASIIRSIAPPLLFVSIATLGIAVPIALYAPMTTLVQGLSGGFAGGPGFGPGFGPGLGPGVTADFAPRPLHLIVLLFPLLALMLGRRLLFRGQRGTGRSVLESAFYLMEWRMLFAVILAVLGGLTWIPLIPLAILALISAGLSYFRYLQLERRSLLTSLAIGSDRGVPLHEVAQSCAEELKGSLQRRTLRLADLLRQGFALSAALKEARLSLPHELKFAVLAAESSGELAPALRAAVALDNTARNENAAVTARISYLVWIFLVVLGVLTFMMLNIVPVFAKMFQHADIPLPGPTVLLVNATYQLANLWPLVALFVVPATLAFLLLDPFVYFVAALVIPRLELLRLRRHGTTVLRCLAAMARQQRPLGVALGQAAETYPVRIVARRLERVYKEFELGLPWQESLRKFGFISTYDSAVLQAAERAGNLAWALGDVADSMQRRQTLRLRTVVNVLFPLVLLLMGAAVLCIVVGLFLPLTALIEGMAARI